MTPLFGKNNASTKSSGSSAERVVDTFSPFFMSFKSQRKSKLKAPYFQDLILALEEGPNLDWFSAETVELFDRLLELKLLESMEVDPNLLTGEFSDSMVLGTKALEAYEPQDLEKSSLSAHVREAFMSLNLYGHGVELTAKNGELVTCLVSKFKLDDPRGNGIIRYEAYTNPKTGKDLIYCNIDALVHSRYSMVEHANAYPAIHLTYPLVLERALTLCEKFVASSENLAQDRKALFNCSSITEIPQIAFESNVSSHVVAIENVDRGIFSEYRAPVSTRFGFIFTDFSQIPRSLPIVIKILERLTNLLADSYINCEHDMDDEDFQNFATASLRGQDLPELPRWAFPLHVPGSLWPEMVNQTNSKAESYIAKATQAFESNKSTALLNATIGLTSIVYDGASVRHHEYFNDLVYYKGLAHYVDDNLAMDEDELTEFESIAAYLEPFGDSMENSLTQRYLANCYVAFEKWEEANQSLQKSTDFLESWINEMPEGLTKYEQAPILLERVSESLSTRLDIVNLHIQVLRFLNQDKKAEKIGQAAVKLAESFKSDDPKLQEVIQLLG